MNFNKKTLIRIIVIVIIMITSIILSIINLLNFTLISVKLMIVISCVIILIGLGNYFSKNDKIKKFLDRIIEYCSVFAFVFIFLQLLFNFVLFPAVVNQTSMNPTLFEGDRIIVFNGNENIDRFDIVVFQIDVERQNINEEELDEQLWVKRVIGMPGEHIEYRNGQLYVNNELVYESYLYDDNGNFYEGNYLDANGIYKYYNSYTNDFSLKQILLITKNLTINDLESGVIPDDYYLLLGDNRATSWDSRKIGLVHRSQIIGEGKYIISNVFDLEKIGD